MIKVITTRLMSNPMKMTISTRFFFENFMAKKISTARVGVNMPGAPGRTS